MGSNFFIIIRLFKFLLNHNGCLDEHFNHWEQSNQSHPGVQSKKYLH